MTTKEVYSAGLFMSDVGTITPEKAAATAAQALTQLGFTEIRGTAHSATDVEICAAQMSVRLTLSRKTTDLRITVTALPAQGCSDAGTRFAFLLRHLARGLEAEEITWLDSAVRLDAAEFLGALDKAFAPRVPHGAVAAEAKPVLPRRIEFPKRSAKVIALPRNTYTKTDRVIEANVRQALLHEPDAEELAALRAETQNGWTRQSVRVASVSGALAVSALLYQSGAALAGVIGKF